MNNRNKNLLIIGGVTLVLIITLAVSYAFFSYNQAGNMNSKLIVGDIYMKYKETTTLTLNNAMPSDTYLENNYFEFSIDGKNTYTKEDIWYDISLTHGEPSTNENRTIRLDDKFLHFRLVEVVDGDETELIQDKTYNSLDNKRIYVNTIQQILMKK